MRVLIALALVASASAWIEVVGNGRTVPPNELIPAVVDDTNFGRMCLGSASIKKTFKIRANSKDVTLVGTPAVKVENLHVNDSAFSVMAPAPGAQTIASGSTITSGIEFSPSEAGVHYAMYRATSTDIDHPTYEFKISADARVPALDASLTQYGTGFDVLPIMGVRANAITSVAFVLRNLEDCPANIDSITMSGTGAPHYKMDGGQLPLVVDFENFAPLYLTFTGPKSNGNYPMEVTVITGITTAKFGFTALITDGLTQQPTVQPTIDPLCMDKLNADGKPWVDEEDQVCADYDKSVCDTSAGDWPVGSMQTAENMCCVCGGGKQKPPPTMSPVAPTTQPTKAPTSSCEDLTFADGTKFYDAYGPAFDCVWFGSYTSIYCDLYGNQEHKGQTAMKACCSCGGGVDHTIKPPTPAVCQDATLASGAPWHDSFGEKYNCGWYGSNAASYCTKYGGDADSKVEGMMANDACCACKSTPTPPTTAPATQPEDDADAGGFNWGDQCSAGDGEFSIDLPVEKVTEIVGKIPAGKEGVTVSLEALEDIDIQLYDLDDTSTFEEGKAIVGWCSQKDKEAGKNCGLLGKKDMEVLNYYGMEFTYSGYNGQNGKKGNEYITIEGSTTRRLMMKVLPYKTGSAAVTYNWVKSTSDCCKGVKRACGGSFTAEIGEKAYVQIGSIPTGKGDLRVELTSDVDVDVQLYDTDDKSAYPDEGKAIVGYCSSKEKAAGEKNCGLLGGPKEEASMYQSRTYTYSGYNGVDGMKGNEFIEIAGETNRNLNMVFYGYNAGTATVTYYYTQP